MSEIVKPVRIQRKRMKGFNLQSESLKRNGLDCVYVGRPTIFGNPFSFRQRIDGEILILNREQIIEKYKEMIYTPFPIDEKLFDYYRKFQVAAGVLVGITSGVFKNQLKGKNLSCWCREDESCHADVLLEWCKS